MRFVAIAGGESPFIGRAIDISILEDQLRHQPEDRWHPVILSKSTDGPKWLDPMDRDSKKSSFEVVNFEDEESIVRALQSVPFRTLISVPLKIKGGCDQEEIQMKLFNAAIRTGCKRFAPSGTCVGKTPWWVDPRPAVLSPVWERCIAEKDRIECARFNPGCFMNFLALSMFPREAEDAWNMSFRQRMQTLAFGNGYSQGVDYVCQGLPMAISHKFFFTRESNEFRLWAKEDGSSPRVTFTTVKDAGRFIAASLHLEKWEERMDMVGETLTKIEVAQIFMDVTGVTPEFTYCTPKSLLAAGKSKSPVFKFFKEAMLAMCRDELGVGHLDAVVNRLCPDTTPITVREYLTYAFEAAQEYFRDLE